FINRSHDFLRNPRAQPELLQVVHRVRQTPHPGTRLRNTCWALDCHLQDAGEYSLDGNHWAVRKKNTFHLYAPGRSYWERCSREGLPIYDTYFVFRIKDSSALDNLVHPASGFARLTDARDMVFPRIREFFNHPSTEDGNLFWRAQGTLLVTLDRLLTARYVSGFDHEIVPPDTPSKDRMSLAERVDTVLRENWHRRIDLDTLADEVGVSRSSLTHRYRLETGTTPIARHLEFRLEIARSMILKGERLQVVAANTGFCDQYHLSRAFKRLFGESPRNFLRQMNP
ncbi:MAG: AraC family transcriptional regulator, partial [Candidatus Pacebacteria bacterium]|nr:AraC family transcriptional regulator [Candidatus Paceibacterota bacterium]